MYYRQAGAVDQICRGYNVNEGGGESLEIDGIDKEMEKFVNIGWQFCMYAGL
jgi:hypothetical protein